MLLFGGQVRLETRRDLRNHSNGFPTSAFTRPEGRLPFSCSSPHARRVLVMAGTDWERIGDYVARRRNELGVKQGGTPDVSKTTWYKLENHTQTSYKPFLLAAVERHLRWAPGSIMQIGAGGEPVEVRGDDRVANLEAGLDSLRNQVNELERLIRSMLNRR